MESALQMLSGKVLSIVVIFGLAFALRSGSWAFELDLRSAYPAFSEAVLFPFDRDCIPFRHALQMQLMKSKWDGADDDDDRRYLKMNLGLVVTHDGLKFEEPIPDFQMIRNIEEGWADDRPMGYPPRLAQGQGMAQVGNRTLAYYSHWGKGGSHQIWIANWDRDRLGFFSPTTDPNEGQWMTDTCHTHLISCPIQLGPDGASIHLNVSNLSELGCLTVEVLDRQFSPIRGYTADEAKPIKGGGFEVEARWNEHDRVEGTDGPIRIRVNWHGARKEDPRLYAIYVRNR